MNRSTSKRTRENIFGDKNKAYVVDANTITCRFVLLCMVAVARGCQLLVEQPSGSIMLQFPYRRFFAVMITSKPWDTVRFPMGAYGHPNKKPTLLFGTATWIKKLYRKLTAKDKRRLQANKAVAKYQMVKKTISKTTGKISVSGSKGIRV